MLVVVRQICRFRSFPNSVWIWVEILFTCTHICRIPKIWVYNPLKAYIWHIDIQLLADCMYENVVRLLLIFIYWGARDVWCQKPSPSSLLWLLLWLLLLLLLLLLLSRFFIHIANVVFISLSTRLLNLYLYISLNSINSLTIFKTNRKVNVEVARATTRGERPYFFWRQRVALAFFHCVLRFLARHSVSHVEKNTVRLHRPGIRSVRDCRHLHRRFITVSREMEQVAMELSHFTVLLYHNMSSNVTFGLMFNVLKWPNCWLMRPETIPLQVGRKQYIYGIHLCVCVCGGMCASLYVCPCFRVRSSDMI